MIKLTKFRFENLLFLFFICLFVSSCCKHDEPTLENLRICDVDKDQLESATCDATSTSFSKDIPFLTASVEAYAVESNDRITFRLINVTNGANTVISEQTQTVSSILADNEDASCGIRTAFSWRTTSGGDWPEADFKIEAELQGEVSAVVSKNVSIN